MSTSNRAPLDQYLIAVKRAVLSAFDAVEVERPDWRVESTTLTVRCAAPAIVDDKGNVTGIEADTNPTDNQQVIEVVMPLVRTGIVPVTPTP